MENNNLIEKNLGINTPEWIKKNVESCINEALQNNFSEEYFDEIFQNIEKAFKQGTVNICPKCNVVANVVPNPHYYWKCSECGFESNYVSLPIKTTKDFVREILKKINNEKSFISENLY